MAGDPIFTNVVMNVHPRASDVHGRLSEMDRRTATFTNAVVNVDPPAGHFTSRLVKIGSPASGIGSLDSELALSANDVRSPLSDVGRPPGRRTAATQRNRSGVDIELRGLPPPPSSSPRAAARPRALQGRRQLVVVALRHGARPRRRRFDARLNRRGRRRCFFRRQHPHLPLQRDRSLRRRCVTFRGSRTATRARRRVLLGRLFLRLGLGFDLIDLRPHPPNVSKAL